MRRIILLFGISGFVLGTLAGLIGYFLLAPDGGRPVEASTRAPHFHLSGIDGASPGVNATIMGVLRRQLVAGGAVVAEAPDACAVDVGAIFSHRMNGEEAVVTLVWLVHEPRGPEIARVRMVNTVPAAMVHGDWSGDAPHIARSVENALKRIFTENPLPDC